MNFILVHGCSGQRMQMNMSVIMVWAWMLWSAYAVEHERYYGLGMVALVSVCSRTRTLSWFGHGCSGHRMQSNMNAAMQMWNQNSSHPWSNGA